MEKVYMEVPKTNKRVWKSNDISPYDFKEDARMNNITMPSYQNEEEEFDMDAIMNELNNIDDELERECMHEDDMYDIGNIDWRWNEDVRNQSQRMHIERKTVVEEENPKRKTTTWMKVIRSY